MHWTHASPKDGDRPHWAGVASGSCLAALFASVTACSQAAPPSGRTVDGSGSGNHVGSVGSGGQAPTTGIVGLRLLVGPNVSLTSCQYTLSNGQYIYEGFVPLGDASTTGPVTFIEGGVASGTGYVLTIQATDTRGDPCAGTSSPFTVAASIVNGVALAVTCVIPTDSAVPADIDAVTICEGCIDASADDAPAQ